MTPWAYVLAATMIVTLPARPGPVRTAEPRRMACLGDAETRAAMQAQKTISPTRALAEALRDGGGETVAIHLCRVEDAVLAYDVAVLRRDGRLVHVLIDARTGAVMPSRKP